MDLGSLKEECIIVAEDLTPSDTAQMNKEAVIGLVTGLGGKNSHTSIMARTLEIPAITGLKGITNVAKWRFYDNPWQGRIDIIKSI